MIRIKQTTLSLVVVHEVVDISLSLGLGNCGRWLAFDYRA